MQVTGGGGLIGVAPHTQFPRRFLLTVRIGNADINILQSVPVLDIFTVYGSMLLPGFIIFVDIA